MRAVCTFAFRSLLYAILFVSPFAVYAQPSLKVRSINFEGNHLFSADRLASVFLLKKDGVFSEVVLRSDLDRLIDLYKNEAYLYAQIDSVFMKRDSVRQNVDVSVFLHEGKPSVVRQIELEGGHHFSTIELSAFMQLHTGDLFTPSLLEQDIQSLLQFYERQGYPLTKVVVQNISFTDSIHEMSVRVQLHIDEGRELHIAALRIEGNKTTKEYVITREARLHQNEVFRSDLPEKIKRRLDHL